MGSFSKKEQETLLKHARAAIYNTLHQTETGDSSAEANFPALKENRGCFVTLQIRGRLRGCIGTIEPTYPLLEAVEHNARNAAFYDPRFSPVTTEELSKIDIEISVLSVPQRLEFFDPEDLKRKLKRGIHGVILTKGSRSAVFLPQVWKQLPDKERFLEHLCMKCGLAKEAWKEPDTQVSVYEAEYFSES